MPQASCRGRILTLCYEHPPLGGGGGKVARSLSDQLGERGFNIDFITMKGSALPTTRHMGGLTLHQMLSWRHSPVVCSAGEMLPYIMHSVVHALRLVRRQRYDHNLSHFVFPDGLACLAVKWSTGLPYVVIAHGSDVPGYNPHRFKLLHGILRPLWRLIVHNAATIVCPSQAVRDLVRSVSPNAKTVLIPNGIEPERFVPDRPKSDRILVVTRMLQRKGVQHLIEALAGLPGSFELHVAGDGPYLPTLRALAASKQVNVVFHGALPNDSADLRHLYETSRIFAFTSEMENFPMVLLEAMAAGCAIVTSSGNGCAEAVGDEALLVTPGDVPATRSALARLMADPGLCARMGIGARRRVEEHFAWNRIVQRYIALLESTRK